MPKTIQGTFQFPDGTPANGATLYLKLSQDAVALGTSQVAPKVVTITLNASGQIPGNTTVYANDELTPNGTVYIASVIATGGGLVYGPELLSISGTSPINLNNLTPTNVGGIVISYPNPVLQNPSAPQTITGQGLTLSPTCPLTIQGAATFSASTTFSGNPTFTGAPSFSGNPTFSGASPTIGFLNAATTLAVTTGNNNGGNLTISAESANGFVNNTGGNLLLTAGTSTGNVPGGSITLAAGGTVSGSGGNIILTPGNSGTGPKGFLNIGTVIGSYNGILTAGNGASIVYSVTSQKTESAADTNVLTFTPPAVVGSYRIRFIMSISAANAATLGWTATWTDSNGNAQTPTNLSLFQVGTAAPALTFTTSAAGNYYGYLDVDVNNAAASVVVKLTFSGTSFTAKVTATVERIV